MYDDYDDDAPWSNLVPLFDEHGRELLPGERLARATRTLTEQATEAIVELDAWLRDEYPNVSLPARQQVLADAAAEAGRQVMKCVRVMAAQLGVAREH